MPQEAAVAAGSPPKVCPHPCRGRGPSGLGVAVFLALAIFQPWLAWGGSAGRGGGASHLAAASDCALGKRCPAHASAGRGSANAHSAAAALAHDGGPRIEMRRDGETDGLPLPKPSLADAPDADQLHAINPSRRFDGPGASQLALITQDTWADGKLARHPVPDAHARIAGATPAAYLQSRAPPRS